MKKSRNQLFRVFLQGCNFAPLGTVTAEMAMMFGEFYKPTATMDYPLGGVKVPRFLL